MFDVTKGICPVCGSDEMKIVTDANMIRQDYDSEPYYRGTIESSCKECGYYNEEII